MIYFTFTIDGDWEEYYSTDLPAEKRKPEKKIFLAWLDKELALAARYLQGKFIHFIHTSPLARDFFLQSEFIAKWQEIEAQGGNVGLHCHEDQPHKAYYYDDAEKMKKAIGFLAAGLREKKISPVANRAGYLAFSAKTIPILEANNILLDFSCEPGRYLWHEKKLVSDWRGAPDNIYRLDHNDHRRAGDSRVLEIPLAIYIERDPLWRIWRKALALKRKGGFQIVSVLTHSYEYNSFWRRVKIKLAILILKRYGSFVGAKEIEKLAKGGKL
ncbi:MAG: hypothetical protein ABIH50_06035 [bacterium]